MIDQNNNFHDKKRFGPRVSNTHKIHIIPRNTKTFTVETSQINLNTPKTAEIQNIDGKIHKTTVCYDRV